MTKSKKQFAAQQGQGTTDDFHRTVELAFGEHPWPASRGELLEHASQHGAFAKSDIARLKQIPHREYTSVADLMNAAREAGASRDQGPGRVTTAEHNRRVMGDVSANAHMQSTVQYDEQTR